MRLLAAVTLVACAALLSGCGAAYHSALRSSFKTSFIHSCTTSGGTDKLCACVEDKIEAANTDDQLTKMKADDPATSQMLTDDEKACEAKAK